MSTTWNLQWCLSPVNIASLVYTNPFAGLIPLDSSRRGNQRMELRR